MKATASRDTASATPSGPRPRRHRRRAAEAGGDDTGPEPAGAARRVPRLLHRDHDGDVRPAQGLGRRRRRGRLRLHPGRARLPDPVRPHRAPARRPARRAGPAPARSPRSARCTARSTARSCSTSVSSASRSRTELAATRLLRAASSSTPSEAARARRPRPHRRRRARPALPRRRRRCTRSSPGAATTCAATPARSRSPAGARTRTSDLRATALREAEEEIGLPPDAVELVGALPAHADDRDELRRLSVRRPDRARPRVAAVGRGGRRGARALARRPARRATSAGACCAAASRSAPTSTSSATTSSGARRPGSSRTCSSASPTSCSDERGRTCSRQPWPATGETYVATAGRSAPRDSLPLSAGIGPPPFSTWRSDRRLGRLELVEVRADLSRWSPRVGQRVAAAAVRA